jgi:type III secretion system FlhB-like substrate exporter
LGTKDDRAPLSLHVKGEAQLAELILSLATKHNIPVIERRGVYDLFEGVQIDEEIPAEYHALIELLREEISKDLINHVS